MNVHDLIDLQITLEYQLDQDGLLVPFPGGSEQAWYIVYQYSQGYNSYFICGLSAEVRQLLLALGPQAAFESPQKVKHLLRESSRSYDGREEIYWSGYFRRSSKPDELPLVTREGENWVILQDGHVVSRAISIRQNDSCAEVYVETQSAYRRKGFGRQVVAAWAREILNGRRVPFYSYKLGNSASAALARSLGVEWYAYVVMYAPKEKTEVV